MIIETYRNWQIIETSATPEHSTKRVALNTATGDVLHLCDSNAEHWDPDVSIPQEVIDLNINNLPTLSKR